MEDFTPGERLVLGISVFSAALGIIAAYVSPSVGAFILKDFLVFSGGGGVAFVLARAYARAATTDRVRSLCNRAVQRLGLVAAHIRDAAFELSGHPDIRTDARLRIVGDSLHSVMGEAIVSIGDLEEMAGAKIRLDPLVETAMDQVRAAVEKALPSGEPDVKERVLTAIDKPLRALEQQIKRKLSMLLIVKGTEMERYAYLRYVFASENLEVILDRRSREPRRLVNGPFATERRRGERRQIDRRAELESLGWTLVSR